MLALVLTAFATFAETNTFPHVAQGQPLLTLRAVTTRLGSDAGLTEGQLAKWAGPAIGRTPNGELKWKLADGILLTGRSPEPGIDPIPCWKRER